jgi:SAM-dependent methyltransferase
MLPSVTSHAPHPARPPRQLLNVPALAASRNRRPELMDDPSLDDAAHREALRGLRRINWWSRTDAVMGHAIRGLAAGSSSIAPLTILDIASGGGDLAIGLARIAARERLFVQIDGCDLSPTAVRFATEQAASAQATHVRFHECDALAQPFPRPRYDVVMSSLFLHHLSEEHAVLLLKRMKAAARRLVLVDDLRRTAAGYWMAWIGCRLLSRCPIVHLDGPTSVQGAFTTEEAGLMAEQAGLVDPVVRSHWPQRFLLTWRPDCAGADERS